MLRSVNSKTEFIMYKHTTLKNGLQVITHKMPGASSISLGIWIKAGGRNEKESSAGISHFLEHLVFKGTKKYSCEGLKQSIEGIGGSLNGFTSMEHTCFLVKVLAKHMNLALDVLSEMVLLPVLKTSDIQREKGVILAELKMYQDRPAHLVHDFLEKIMWPNQSLGRPLIGKEKTILSVNRNKLIQYREKHYVPDNIVITACGDVSHDKLIKTVKARFGGLAGKQKTMFDKALICEGSRSKLHSKKTEQTRIALGFYAYPAEHKDRFALSMLHIILGGNMSSRLFNEVREKRGLAYDISSGIRRYSDTGVFTIDAGVAHKKTVESIRIILEQLKKMKTRAVTKDELKRAQEYYIGQFFLMMEETLEHMFWIGDEFLDSGEVKTPQYILKHVKKVSIDDIIRVARDIFIEDHLRLAVVGPLEANQKKQIEKLI